MDIGVRTSGATDADVMGSPSSSSAAPPALWSPKCGDGGEAAPFPPNCGLDVQAPGHWSAPVYGDQLVPKIICSRCKWVYPTGVFRCHNRLCAEPPIEEVINDLQSNRTGEKVRREYMANCGLSQWSQSRTQRVNTYKLRRLDERACKIHKCPGGHSEQYDTDWEYFVWCRQHGAPRICSSSSQVPPS